MLFIPVEFVLSYARRAGMYIIVVRSEAIWLNAEQAGKVEIANPARINATYGLFTRFKKINNIMNIEISYYFIHQISYV